MFLQVGDEEVDVRAGVKRFAALHDHGIAAIPDEIGRRDANARGRIDSAAVERDGGAIEALTARALWIDLIGHTPRDLKNAGLQHRDQRGAGDGANFDTIAEWQHVERLRKGHGGGTAGRVSRLPDEIGADSSVVPQRELSTSGRRRRGLFQDRIGDDIAERRLVGVICGFHDRRGKSADVALTLQREERPVMIDDAGDRGRLRDVATHNYIAGRLRHDLAGRAIDPQIDAGNQRRRGCRTIDRISGLIC